MHYLSSANARFPKHCPGWRKTLEDEIRGHSSQRNNKLSIMHLLTSTYECKSRKLDITISFRVKNAPPNTLNFIDFNELVAYLVSTNNGGTYYAKIVRKAYLKNFFSSPIESSKAGIYLVENIGTTGIIRTIHEDLLARKCMSIARKSSNVVLELIHK